MYGFQGVFIENKILFRMLAYDRWENRECIASMRAAPSLSRDTLGRMAYILSAQKLWLERILKQRPSYGPTSTIDRARNWYSIRDSVRKHGPYGHGIETKAP
jgi:hypothetical protein